MTLRELLREGAPVAGLPLRIPRWRSRGLPRAVMEIRSSWPMGDTARGLWMIEPGKRDGRVYPLFNVSPDELLDEWEVVDA